MSHEEAIDELQKTPPTITIKPTDYRKEAKDTLESALLDAAETMRDLVNTGFNETTRFRAAAYLLDSLLLRPPKESGGDLIDDLLKEFYTTNDKSDL